MEQSQFAGGASDRKAGGAFDRNRAIGQRLRYELGNFWIVIVGAAAGYALATIAQITATACLAADIRDLTAAGLGSGAPPGPRRIDSMRATLYNG